MGNSNGLLSEIFTKRAMKIGVMFGIVVAVINVVSSLVNNFIPFIIFISWISIFFVWIILLVAGYLNGIFENFNRDNLVLVIKKSVGVALWAALVIGVVSGLLDALLLLVPRTQVLFGITYTQTNFSLVLAIFTLLSSMLSALISGLFWVILGGVVNAFYPLTSLPQEVQNFMNKLKNYFNK